MFALFPTVYCLPVAGDLSDAKQGDPKLLGFPDSRLLSLSAPMKSRASFSLPYQCLTFCPGQGAALLGTRELSEGESW